MTDEGRRVNLDWDEAYCEACRGQLFSVDPPPTRPYVEFNAEEARQFIRNSRCAYCGGRVIVPLWAGTPTDA